MKYIDKIISLFLKNSFPSDLVMKIHLRLLKGEYSDEENEFLKEKWNKLTCNSDSIADIEAEYSKVCKRLSLTTNKKKSLVTNKGVLVVAASWFLLLISIGVSFYCYNKSEKLSSLIVQNSLEEVYVEKGMRKEIQLPDGSIVWINAQSTLIYQKNFLGKERNVLLLGEAFFKVKKDPEKPFVVNTHAIDIKVLGTEFNVSAYPDNKNIITTLQDGSVDINNKSDFKDIRLKPNEQYIYNKISNQGRIEKVNAVDFSDWIQGGLCFNNTELKEIVQMLEKIYNVNIILNNSSYLENHLTVHFNKNEPLRTVLLLIREMVPQMNYKIEDKAIILY